MLRRLIICTSAVIMFAGAPQYSQAEEVMELGVMEMTEDRQVTISADQNIVSVTGAAGMTLEVVSLTGRHVASFTIESASQRIELNLPKGCYILKVGKVVRKVSIR